MKEDAIFFTPVNNITLTHRLQLTATLVYLLWQWISQCKACTERERKKKGSIKFDHVDNVDSGVDCVEVVDCVEFLALPKIKTLKREMLRPAEETLTLSSRFIIHRPCTRTPKKLFP